MTQNQNLSQLTGKCILVTGGGRGIGRAIVERLAAAGAQVIFTYSKSRSEAEKVLERLDRLHGTQHQALMMDVCDEQSVADTFEKANQIFYGKLDGLVNNAGIAKDQLLLRMKAEDFDSVIHTNLRGVFFCTRAAIKIMIKSKQGSIVNITSVIGQMGNPGQSNYAASKAGIEAFTKSVAQEVGSRFIRLNCVSPGFIETDMTHGMNQSSRSAILSKIALGYPGKPEDVAQVVEFLLSDQSKYMTGQSLCVNGGLYM